MTPTFFRGIGEDPDVTQQTSAAYGRVAVGKKKKLIKSATDGIKVKARMKGCVGPKLG